MLKELVPNFSAELFTLGREDQLCADEFGANPGKIIQEFHAFDSDIVFQACFLDRDEAG
jgi:hypothetical protein